MNRRLIRVMSLSILILTVWGCGPSAAEKQSNRRIGEAHINDPMALMPEWYRSRMTATDQNDYGMFYSSQLLQSILVLGFFVYGTAGLILVIRGSKAGASDDEFWGLLVGLPLGLLIAAPIVAGAAYHLLYVVLGVVTAKSYYVPWHFINFCIHALLIAGFVSYPIAASVRSWLVGACPTDSGPAPSSPAGGDSAPKRIRWRPGRLLLHCVRAVFVAVATAIGTKIGGAIGGFVAVGIASAISAFFNIPESDYQPEEASE